MTLKKTWFFTAACLLLTVSLILGGCKDGSSERIAQPGDGQNMARDTSEQGSAGLHGAPEDSGKLSGSLEQSTQDDTSKDSGNLSGSLEQSTQDGASKNSGGQSSAKIQEDFQLFCDRVFQEEMSSAGTLDLHYTLLHPEQYGIEPEEVSLGTVSLQEMISSASDTRELKQELEQFDRSMLSLEQRILYDSLWENLNTSLLSEGMELYDQPLAPTIGVQAQLPILLSEYSFQSMNDVENYLTLLSQIDAYYGQLLEFENQKADAGLAPSDASIDGIIASCQGYLVEPEANFLTETFDLRLASLPESERPSESAADELKNRHISIIRSHFIPAYQSIIDGMTALKGRGIQDGGLAGMKEGRKYYEYLLKSGTGTSYTVPQLKNALEAQMDSDLQTISRLYKKYPDLDDCLKNASFSLTAPDDILRDLRQKIKADFPALPDCDYEIRYVPKYLEESLSPAFYLTAPVDDIDHNVIYINNGYSDSTDSLYTTLAHEGFPGHLYQTVYARATASHPLEALLSCSGANEGWATYVENYAYTLDNGLAPGVGAYRAALRSFSLCVHGLLDIGVNYDGWDLEQVKKFITSCFAADDAMVSQLYQTMIDNPTNYLEYCNGYIELTEMRKQAESVLGSRFTPMEFHRFILDMGPVPYSVLRNYFSDWLTTAK